MKQQNRQVQLRKHSGLNRSVPSLTLTHVTTVNLFFLMTFVSIATEKTTCFLS